MEMSPPLVFSEVENQAELKEFIHLPAKLHKYHHNWVPPLYRDEWAYFNPKKNRALQYCDTLLMMCFLEGIPIGRIMGIINHRHNEMHGIKTARFALLECTDHHEAIAGLLASVENWAAERGMDRIIGPFGMTLFDAEGFMIEGFEHSPSVSTYYNYPYMKKGMEDCGYHREEDLSVFKIPIPDEIPEFYQKIHNRVMERNSFSLMEFTKRSQLKDYIRPILSLMNECFVGIYGFTKMDELEMDDIAKQYMSFLDPRFIKAVLKDGEVIAFIIAMPNISNGLRKSRGYLLPVGFIPILRDFKKSRQLDLLLGAIKEEYQGKGLDVMMGLKTIESAKAAGFTVMDSHLELDSNYKVQGEMRRMGGEVYKRYRIYQKRI